MRLIKSLERLAKSALAALLALLLFRPWRQARLATLAGAQRILLVRIDQRVGEVLLTTPLISRLAHAGREVHVLVHPKMIRVVDGLPGVAKIWAFDRSFRSLLALRAANFEAVINCGNWSTPAVTSAIATRLIAARGVAVGPATAPVSWLMDSTVAPLPNEPSELAQRAHFIDALEPATALPRMSFRAPRPTAEVTAFLATLPARYAVVNPGGRLGERRVSAQVFGQACHLLAEAGLTPVVTWGPGEEPLADQVCAQCPQAVRAVPTDLDGLAALLAGASMALCNNTGPMHLAVALGCPTLALFSRIDMARWGHRHPPHHAVDLTPLLSVESATGLQALVATELSRFLATLPRASASAEPTDDATPGAPIHRSASQAM